MRRSSRCLICDRAAKPDGPLCAACEASFQGIDGTLCPRCSRRVGACRCAQSSLYFSRCVVLSYYEGAAKQFVLELKGRGHDRAADLLAFYLARHLQRQAQYRDIDLVLWVPKFLGDYLKNGINASQMLALRTAKRLGLPCKGRVLVKKRKTRKQTRLTYAQREENLRDAFAVLRPGEVKHKRILLVDDVITTGSTMSECARTLYFAGAKEVLGAAVCATKIRARG